jgi:cell division septal protein FtsQ
MFRSRRKNNSSIFAAPEKPRRRPGRKVSWRAVFFGGFFVLVFIGISYLAIWAPFFKIKEMEIASQNFAAETEVNLTAKEFLEKKLLKIIPNNSFFIFSSRCLKELILDKFPDVESIEIEKNIFGGLKIKIKGRQANAIWCESKKNLIPSLAPSLNSSTSSFQEIIENKLPESEKCFFLDNEGMLFRESPEISGTLLPTFYNQTNQEFNLKEQPVASSTIVFASQIKKYLRQTGVDFQGFLIQLSTGSEIAALTSEGWMIYFDANRLAQTQAKIVETLLENEIKDKRAGLKYIDLRMANRVYYK